MWFYRSHRLLLRQRLLRSAASLLCAKCSLLKEQIRQGGGHNRKRGPRLLRTGGGQLGRHASEAAHNRLRERVLLVLPRSVARDRKQRGSFHKGWCSAP